MELGERSVSRPDSHDGAQSVPVRGGADELHLQKVNRLARAQAVDQHHGSVVHLVGHDVEVAVVVEIEQHRGARAERAVDG